MRLAAMPEASVMAGFWIEPAWIPGEKLVEATANEHNEPAANGGDAATSQTFTARFPPNPATLKSLQHAARSDER